MDRFLRANWQSASGGLPPADHNGSCSDWNCATSADLTPTGCSWLNLVECFFSVITRQAIRRGSFTSVKELTAVIGAFVDGWNDHPRPFAWTKDASQILANVNRAKTKTSVLTVH